MKRLSVTVHRPMIPSDQSGVSLVAVMVAVGLLGIMALGVSQMFANAIIAL